MHWHAEGAHGSDRGVLGVRVRSQRGLALRRSARRYAGRPELARPHRGCCRARDHARVRRRAERPLPRASRQLDVRGLLHPISDQSTQVQVRTRLNAAVSTATVDLAYDRRRLVEGAVAGWLDLGNLDEGIQVSLEVEGVSSIVDLQSNVRVGGCSLATAYDRCQGPGCMARSALTVVSAACQQPVP